MGTIANRSRVRPRIDLSRHMAECDANYARMLKLAPDGREEGALRCFVLPRPQARRLVVRVTLTEQHRYTSTYRIDFAEAVLAAGAQVAGDPTKPEADASDTAGGGAGSGAAASVVGADVGDALVPAAVEAGAASAFELPTMTVRLYHDARSAEILDVTGQRQLQGFYDYPNVAMMQPDEKAQQNRFLAEFLGVSLATGVALPRPPRHLFRLSRVPSGVTRSGDADWLRDLRTGRAIVGDSP